MFSILRPYIFNLDPEVAHDLAIKSLKLNLIPKSFFSLANENLLNIELFGMKFENPIGLAAGFDKSAEVYNALFNLGFGFVEVGTITPKKQLGNPKPRIFRLEKDLALINRLGFNNEGLEIVKNRISHNSPKGILGVNVGPNKDTKDKKSDFIKCIISLHKISNYITINISSPNTEGLRDFHKEEFFSDLLKDLENIKKKEKINKPILIKISPDISENSIEPLINLILKYKIDGLIISNSTDKNRENLVDTKKNEIGGLSGKPLENLSNKIIKDFYKALKGRIPIIGVGGVDSSESALEKISAGASAVQLYTGMVYKGPGIVKEIKQGMISFLQNEKINNIKDIIGSKS